MFAMLMDIGILLGEMVTRRRPIWRWALDLDPLHAPGCEQQEQGAWQQSVLFRPADPPAPAATLDLQGNVAALCLYGRGSSATVLQRELERDLLDAISERTEHVWRGTDE